MMNMLVTHIIIIIIIINITSIIMIIIIVIDYHYYHKDDLNATFQVDQIELTSFIVATVRTV